MIKTVGLLILSNLFMTYAWYGHLKTLNSRPLWMAIGLSWGIAFLEYCFQVPANRIGYQYFSLAQLKIIQEVITMIIFSLFAIFFMKEELNRNFFYASLCLVGAVYFIFRRQILMKFYLRKVVKESFDSCQEVLPGNKNQMNNL